MDEVQKELPTGTKELDTMLAKCDVDIGILQRLHIESVAKSLRIIASIRAISNQLEFWKNKRRIITKQKDLITKE